MFFDNDNLYEMMFLKILEYMKYYINVSQWSRDLDIYRKMLVSYLSEIHCVSKYE